MTSPQLSIFWDAMITYVARTELYTVCGNMPDEVAGITCEEPLILAISVIFDGKHLQIGPALRATVVGNALIPCKDLILVLV